MIRNLLLVDFENVHTFDPSQLGTHFKTIVFMGEHQKNLPADLVARTQKLGGRLEWLRIEGNGHNALDFHIACHLGHVLATEPSLHCTVLSKDKGFDPLLRYLKNNGLECQRVESFKEVAHKKAPPKTAPNPPKKPKNCAKSGSLAVSPKAPLSITHAPN